MSNLYFIVILYFSCTYYNVCAQELLLKSGESYQICDEELELHQLFVHKGITYIDVTSSKNKDTLSLSIGERINYLPCDAYISNIRKIGNKPAVCSVKLSKPESATFVYVPEFDLSMGKLYEMDKVKIELLEAKNNQFHLQFQLEDRAWFGLKSFIWLGGSMYQITEFKNNKLTFRRLQEFIVTSNDTLFSHVPVFTQKEEMKKNEFSNAEPSFEYRIVFISDVHCAKGSKNCTKCAAVAQDYRWRLVKKYIGHVYFAAPVMEFQEGDKKTFSAFGIVKAFENQEEAEKYSSENNIPMLEPEDPR